MAPETHPKGMNWQPGDAPSQMLDWAVEALSKTGSLSIIGVYPPIAHFFPIGIAMNKNLTIRMGNCPHARYVSKLKNLMQQGLIDPLSILPEQKENFFPLLKLIKHSIYECLDGLK